MRLRRFFVAGFPRESASAVAEFLLFHGVQTVTVTDRDDLEKIQVDCHYGASGGYAE